MMTSRCFHSLYFVSLLLSAIVLIACGGDTETVRVTDRYTLDMLGKGVSLTEETCDSARLGQLLYVGDSSSIYYCTGKAWKKVNGKDGKDGRDGKDGEDGVDGQKGKYGTSGTDCFVEEFADGIVLGCGATKAIVRYDFEIPDTCSIRLTEDSSYVLTCGKDSTTLLQGAQGDDGDLCKQSDIGGGQVRLVCGSDSVILYKAACGDTPFDPDGLLFCYGDTLVERCNTHVYDIEKQFCYGDSLIALCGGKTYDLKERFCYGDSVVIPCGDNDYDLSQQFCYNDSLVNLCGTQDYDLTQQFCYNDSLVDYCNGKDYNLAQQFCYNDSLVDLCGDKDYDLKKQFCYEDSVYSYCGWKKFNPAQEFCFGESIEIKCGGETYNPETQFCYYGPLAEECPGYDYDIYFDICSPLYDYSMGTVENRCGGKKYDPNLQYCKDGVRYGTCDGVEYNFDHEFCDRRNGRIYRFTEIGGKTWMAQNLDYKVPNSFCDTVYKDGKEHCGLKGRFYPWSVAMQVSESECGYGHNCSDRITYPHQGVCPNGWHIPTKEEWEALVEVMGEEDLVYWDVSVDLSKRDKVYPKDPYGFSAIPTGTVPIEYREQDQSFHRQENADVPIYPNGFDAWSMTETESGKSAYVCFFYADASYNGLVQIKAPLKNEDRTVRCVKD
ncbi:MAG: hypothetical protein J5791_10390 [Fibrobacter sp.]|nr:hypothetical protein [Fibrobacter sp.]